MSNEPVAYGMLTFCKNCGEQNPYSVKELTDEEIQELALSDEFWMSEDCTIFDWHKFAKAIEKKIKNGN